MTEPTPSGSNRRTVHLVAVMTVDVDPDKIRESHRFAELVETGGMVNMADEPGAPHIDEATVWALINVLTLRNLSGGDAYQVPTLVPVDHSTEGYTIRHITQWSPLQTALFYLNPPPPEGATQES